MCFSAGALQNKIKEYQKEEQEDIKHKEEMDIFLNAFEQKRRSMYLDKKYVDLLFCLDI